VVWVDVLPTTAIAKLLKEVMTLVLIVGITKNVIGKRKGSIS
jgi:hypothetical protein